MDAVELREAALAAIVSARDHIRNNPHATRANQDRFLALFTEASTAVGAYENASGQKRPAIASDDPQDRLTQLYGWLGGPAPDAGMGNGIPFPGAGSTAGKRTASMSGVSLGALFLEQRQARAGGVNFGAQILESGSTAVPVPLRTQPITDPRRARFLFELLPEADAPSGVFSYMKQTLRDLNAAVVARGERKPTSQFRLERETGQTDVIAHLTEPIDRFDIEDAGMLRQFIDDELALGVNLALDQVTVAAIADQATTGEATVDLANIRSAITDLQLIDLQPDAIALNPSDWETIEIASTESINDNAPNSIVDAMARRLYGVPVTVTNAINAGAAIVGDFAGSGLVFVTGGVRIDVSDSVYMADAGDGQPGSTFEQNTLILRGERRATPVVARPAGFILVGAVSS